MLELPGKKTAPALVSQPHTRARRSSGEGFDVETMVEANPVMVQAPEPAASRELATYLQLERGRPS